MYSKLLRSLCELHRRIDDQIKDEDRKLRPDVLRIKQLKKRKLALKDRIAASGQLAM